MRKTVLFSLYFAVIFGACGTNTEAIKASQPAGYGLIVDYPKPLAEDIAQFGPSLVHPLVQRFKYQPPYLEPRKVSFVIIRLPEPMNTSSVQAEFKRLGYRPADLKELFVFMMNSDNMRFKDMVIAIGSTITTIGEQRYMPCAIGLLGRYIDVEAERDMWDKNVLFLGVRE